MPKDTIQLDNKQQDVDNNLIAFFQFMEPMGDKQKRIIWTLYDLGQKYYSVFISQKKLASVIPCCPDHVSRTLLKFQNKKYIQIERRGNQKTNIYHLGEILSMKHLKKYWLQYLDNKRFNSPKVESEVESLIFTERPPDKHSDAIKIPPPYLPYFSNIVIRLEDRNSKSRCASEKIKEAFEGFDWPEKDKILLSRESDECIKYAMDQLCNFIETGEEIGSTLKVFQSKVTQFKKGNIEFFKRTIPEPLVKTCLSEKDALTFSKYSTADIITGMERVDWWYKIKKRLPENLPAFLHTVIKQRIKKNQYRL